MSIGYFLGETIEERLAHHSIPEPNSGCLLWMGDIWQATGYGRARVGKGRRRGVHILAWEIHNKRAVPPGMMICHKCDVPLCIEPLHLFAGSHRQNVEDMMAKGRHPRLSGESCGASKLNADAVRAIRADSRSQKDIANDYGISRPNVSMIKSRRTWRHLP